MDTEDVPEEEIDNIVSRFADLSDSVSKTFVILETGEVLSGDFQIQVVFEANSEDQIEAWVMEESRNIQESLSLE